MLCNPGFSLQLPVLATASLRSTETISLRTSKSLTSSTTGGYMGWDSTEHRGHRLEQRPWLALVQFIWRRGVGVRVLPKQLAARGNRKTVSWGNLVYISYTLQHKLPSCNASVKGKRPDCNINRKQVGAPVLKLVKIFFTHHMQNLNR